MCGYGILTFSDNEKYEGEWDNNERNGYGIMYGSNFIYEGKWKNNKRNGIGALYCQEGRIEGIFENDNLVRSLSNSIYRSSIKGH